MTSTGGVDLIHGRDRRKSARRCLRRRRRYLMIEETAFLVIVDEQRRFAEDARIRNQDVDNLGNVPGAEVWSPVRMFREGFRRDDVRHLRQRAGLDVMPEYVEEPIGIHPV